MTQGYNAVGKKVRTAAEKSSLAQRLGIASGDISKGYSYQRHCIPAEALEHMSGLAVLVEDEAKQQGMFLFYKDPAMAGGYGVEAYEFHGDESVRVGILSIGPEQLPGQLIPGQPFEETTFTVKGVSGFTEDPISIETAA